MKHFVWCLLCSLACCPGLPLAAASPDPSPASATPAPPLKQPAPPSPWEDGGQKLARNDVEGAIASLQAALHTPCSDAARADGCRLLAVALLRVGRNAQAAQTAQTALALAPAADDSRAVSALLLAKSLYSAYAHDYDTCTARASLIPSMRQMVISISTQEYRMPDGSVLVEQIDPDAQSNYADAINDIKARLMALHKSLDTAEAAYKDALAAAPQMPGVHDGMGLILEARGFPTQARHEFVTERHEHGPSGTVLLHLGELDNAEGDPDTALLVLRHAVRLSPQLHGPYDVLADIYDSRHDDERARWARGMAALVQGNLKGAGAAFGSSVPATDDLCRGMAALALANKQPDAARALLARALSLNARSQETLDMLGDMEEDAGHDQAALDAYHQALAVNVNDDKAWYGIGLVYDRQNNRDSALADYKQALQCCPNNPEACLNAADDEANLGQCSQAIVALQDYLQRFPTATNIYPVQAMLAHLQAPASAVEAQ